MKVYVNYRDKGNDDVTCPKHNKHMHCETISLVLQGSLTLFILSWIKTITTTITKCESSIFSHVKSLEDMWTCRI